MNLFKYKEKYRDEVLRRFLPMGETNGISFRAADSEIIPIKLELSTSHKHYKNSKYYYCHPKPLAHYTKLSSAKSILKEGKLRLYNLTKKNDEKEYAFAAEKLGLDSTHINDARENTFICSFISTETQEENCDFWREYGDLGRGCLLLFDASFHDDVLYYHLSKVYYEDCSDIENLFKETAEFEKNYPVQVKINLSRLLPFYKDSKWLKENEIRLMANFKTPLSANLYDQDITTDLPSGSKYKSIPIAGETEDPIIPNLKLAKVILGPNVKDVENEISVIKTLCQDMQYSITPVTSSFMMNNNNA